LIFSKNTHLLGTQRNTTNRHTLHCNCSDESRAAEVFAAFANNLKYCCLRKDDYCFEVGDDAIFAFAGLWDRWIDPQGQAVETCTILTTTPNTLLSDIHDRMPVILNPGDYDVWLTSGSTEAVLNLLRPYAGPTRRFPVSPRVNHVQNDDVDCSMPVELQTPLQGQLFG
jgi:putative SOS response-associated peptidase YedK